MIVGLLIKRLSIQKEIDVYERIVNQNKSSCGAATPRNVTNT